MGNSIASSMIEGQRKLQAEMQEKMMKSQMQNQILGQERMLRRQMAMQVAFSRDMLNWVGSVFGVLVSGVTVAAMRKKPVPKIVGAPIFILGFYSAYLYDMAYGNKINRINGYCNEIMHDNKYWFNPIDMPAASSQNDKKEKSL